MALHQQVLCRREKLLKAVETANKENFLGGKQT